MPQNLFVDLVVVYALALIVMIVGGRVGVPAIISLILTGVLAGPSGLRIIPTPEEVEQLSEIGIVLLLFTVGLDFPIGTLRQLWRSIVSGGVLQIAGTAMVAAAVALAVGLAFRESTFVGFFVALSSTAIVLKELARHNRLDSPAGRLTTGILLFQDLCVVLLLLTAPLLTGTVALDAVPALLARAFAAIVAIVAIARLALPLLFRLVTACGQREAFPLAVLVGSVGTAAAGASLGVSMALGAFLAGLVLAGSEFSQQAHAEVRPLRDLLTSLFFISLGMLIEFSAFARALPLILLIGAAAVIVKALLAGCVLWLTRTPARIAALSAVYLAQVGEFSFVLGRDALERGLLSEDTWQLLLPASVLTMLAAPTLVAIAPRLTEHLRLHSRQPQDVSPEGMEHGAVMVLGFGVGGRLVARTMRQIGVPYRILDMNGATVRAARAAGEPIHYADATIPDTLHAMGIEHCRALVVVLSDPDAALKVLGVAQRLAPAVPVFVRARYRSEAARLQRAGAIAVAEEIEASLEVLTQLLGRLDVAGNVITSMVDDYRREEDTPARHKEAPRVPLARLAPEVLNTSMATHELAASDWATGRSLKELRLRTVTGVSVIAIRRAGHYIPAPDADVELAAGDVLHLLGDEANVAAARERLTLGSARTRDEAP